ncbi:MAG: NUDIX hydrolase [Dehalococcoidia bacterium]|nr:NUDIX hydrolase [Dehalococcoidia bacterium]
MTGIAIAVGAVIRDGQGRVLLVRHRPERKGFWRGKWICPGGGLKLGEEIVAGIEREVAEETGLKIRLDRGLAPFERIVKSGGETRLHVVYIDYLADLVGGDLRPGGDVGEAVWVAPSDLPAMWAELHEDTRKLLKIAGIV